MLSHNIRLFCSAPMHFFRYAEWNQCKNPILYITGLSGSGKTYIGQAISQSTGIPIASLDALKFYDSADSQSRKLVEEFVILHPEIKPLISIQWSKNDDENTNDIKYTDYCLKFFNFILSYAKIMKSMYIVEGIQLFVRIPWTWTTSAPLVILGTSGLRSFYNTYKRDYITMQKPKKLSLMYNEFYLYHCIQRKMLNRFIHFQNMNNIHPTKTDSPIEMYLG